MLASVRRPTATLCLVILALDVTGCHRVQKKEAAAVIQPGAGGEMREHVRGVTLRDGREVQFDAGSRASVRNDTLHSFVRKQEYRVPVADLQRVWIESISPARTTFAVIGVTAGILVTLAAIALATKESCPFVYSWDGTRYVFDAEPYGGAVTRGLERDDYGELEHLRPDSAGRYRLLVTNEVNETQYTNAMRLLVVDHRPGSRFEMDEFGRLHPVTTAVAPASARDQDGRDLVPWLRETDNLIWEPTPPADTKGSVRQEIVLTFPRPRGATRARLVARAGTGLWGSHMIREMLDLRGSAVQQWYAAIDSSRQAHDSLMAWSVREELYILKIDVEERGGWRTRGLLPGGGPFITEHRVVPLDVGNVVGDSLRVRIRPPSGFWALNSFAMSYDDAEQPMAVDTVAPIAARTSDGRDVLPELAAPDERYYAMPTTAHRAVVTFPAPAARPGAQRTVFLHTRGYYRLHLEEQRAPDLAALQRITTVPDATARMAAESYAKRRIAAGSPR